jgi:uncharacterized protein YggE
MRTIRVTGKGQLKVRPDMTRITMSLEGVCPEYSTALRKSSQDTESIKELMASFGFRRSDLKTLDFNVDAQYESYEERGVYKQPLAGYRYHHRLKAEFESDNERLGSILYALARSPVKPELRISYTVKDPEAAKNELLGKAVSDAREKALVLTGAAGVVLKDIKSIDYSWGELDLEVRPMNRMLMADGMASKSESYDMDIEPDDIEITDTVTVVWGIE